MNFESHITLDLKKLKLYPHWKEKMDSLAFEYGWKTSHITDDPVLGPGDKFYLTGHDEDYIELFNNMNSIVEEIISCNIFNYGTVLRKKIELIMIDEIL